MVSEPPARPGLTGLPLDRARYGSAPPAGVGPRAPHEGVAQAHTGPPGVPLATRRAGAQPLPPRPPLHAGVGRDVAHGEIRPCGIVFGALRRELQLARADLVPLELPHHRISAQVPPLLRRRL